MTQHIQKTSRWSETVRGDEASPRGANEQIFFFDGDFRTWGQVEQRALVNVAIAVELSRPRSS